MKLIVCAGLVLVLSACALPDAPNGGYEANNDRQVVTGSNVARKDRGPIGVTYATRDAIEKAQTQGETLRPKD